MWEAMHTITFNYPINPTSRDKKINKEYFTSKKNMLPCKYCRASYKTYLKYLPIDKYLGDRYGLTYWLFTLHNLVNHKIYKPKERFKNIVIKYEQYRAKCGKINVTEKHSYTTCQLKYRNIDDNYIKKIVKRAEKKYKKMTDKFLDKFMESKDNPRKDKIKDIKYDKKDILQNINYKKW